MSRRMADSVSQRDFYRTRNMHYMAQPSTIGETPEDLFHEAHLELQERMRNPIAFHAEMMGDIMYLQQALRQHDAKLFVDAVIKEINGHIDNKNWELVRRILFQKTPKWFLLFGPCNASVISLPMKSRVIKHGSTCMEENRSTV